MTKFQLTKKSRPLIRNRVISVNLPEEVLPSFYTLCEESGFSASKVAAQCIEFALANMQEKK